MSRVWILGLICLITDFNFKLASGTGTTSTNGKATLITDPASGTGTTSTGGKATVSGLSGGAFFSTQFHIAYSETIAGAGMLAGGPFYCAAGDLLLAEGRCMRFPNEIDVDELIAITRTTYATTRTIDDPANLANSRVYLLSAMQDSVVNPGVVKKLEEYYEKLEPTVQIEAVYNISGEHSWLTLDQGSECTYKGEPYINACNYDASGELLQHLYDDALVAPDPSADVSGLDVGELVEFSQRQFIEGTGYSLETAALSDTGYMYVPTTCLGREKTESGMGGTLEGTSENDGSGPSSCRVHVSFHGCEQTTSDIGDAFPRMTGLGQWAGANDLTVIYPQAKRTALNPKGCWDWWGYTGGDYASQLGVQMQAVARMIGELPGMRNGATLGPK
jgi:hypothetical protein